MQFEWRTYTTQPGKAMTYLELYRTIGVSLVTKHLPMLGYWLSETGPLNEIHHLWAYNDFDDRTKRRAGLAQERDWHENFIRQAFEVITAQRSRILMLDRGSERFEAILAARDRVHSGRPQVEACLSTDLCVIAEGHEGERTTLMNPLASFRVALGKDVGRRIDLYENVSVNDWLAQAPGRHDGTETTLLRALTLSPIGGEV